MEKNNSYHLMKKSLNCRIFERSYLLNLLLLFTTLSMQSKGIRNIHYIRQATIYGYILQSL